MTQIPETHKQELEMDFNLFNWIREAVRRSVMLGVADAMESVGTPSSSQDLQASLQSFRARIESPLETAASIGSNLVSPASGASRKRLGRTLKDIES
jgi:hypothetical protein